MTERAGWHGEQPVPMRPDPGREEGVDPRELLDLALRRRQARARTLQLVEWLGFALIVLGIALLAGPAWAIIAGGITLAVIANAS